jgi:class 3 adenylate cyclase/acyl-coenzyme A thioesterase PaaI-like protein
VLNQPVRGIVPEAGIFSLPGLERMRLYQQGRLPATPHARLLGYRMTQVSSGSSVLSQQITPWSEIYDGFVDVTAIAALSASITASTAAPAGVDLRVVTLSVRYLRSLTVDDGSVIARGRLLHAGSSFTTVETLIEDPLGRAAAHATAATVHLALDPPPPAWSPPADEPAQEPVYATPDPYNQSLPPSLDRAMLFPAAAFLGMQVEDQSDTSVGVTMPASPWFSNGRHEVEPGIIAAFGNHTGTFVSAAIAGAERAVAFEVVFNIPGRMPPTDGRELRSRSKLAERIDDMLIIDDRVEDADGRLLGRGHAMVQLRERRARRRNPSNRVLLTVLFTDLVGSTERAGEEGDANWRDVLEDHHATVRHQIEVHSGREVKTTGDGFLATFDSPSRAVQSAKAIKTGLARLGLEIRAGVHTGECELIGADVAGLAVHVASRVESAAQPGEILVSNTVRDLAVGSGIDFVDRGAHELKGISGTWQLFAVADEPPAE